MGYHGMDERELMIARRMERRGRGGSSSPVAIDNDLKRFEEGWAQMMTLIWQEKIQLLRVNDSGALQASIEYRTLLDGVKKTIQHQFLKYGKYSDDGVGREFNNEGYIDSLGRCYGPSRRADGTLPFLLPGGEEYREEHGLDKPKKVGPAWGGRVAGGHPRKAKEWFYRKYYASRMVLNEMERDYYGNAYLGMLTTALGEITGQAKIVL